MKTPMKKPAFRNKGFRITAAILLTALAGYSVYDYTGSKIYVEQPWQHAYTECQDAVTRRGAELEQRILARRTRIPELAEKLTSLEAKWIVMKSLGDKAKINAWISRQVEQSLYNKEENGKLIAQTMAATVADWVNEENELAVELGLPVIGHESKAAPVNLDNIPVPSGVDAELWKQIMYELAANAGGEMAAALATQLAVSGGILTASAATSWASCGISVVVGLLSAWVVELITDPKPELEARLTTQLSQNAATLRAGFEQSMQKVIKKRACNWD